MLQSALLFEYFPGLPRSKDHRVILKQSEYAIKSYVRRTWVTHEAVGIIIIIRHRFLQTFDEPGIFIL